MTWLEQLSSKRLALGIAKTVAVSSSPFSTGAIEVARAYGIDLRLAGDISTEEMQSWLFPISVTHIYKDFELLEAPHLEIDASDARLHDQNLVPADSVDPNDPIFECPGTPKRLSLNDVWQQAQQQVDLYVDVPKDGKKVRKRVNLSISNELHLAASNGHFKVLRLTITGNFFWSHEEVPLSQAAVTKYSAPDCSVPLPIARAEFDSKTAPTNFRLGYQIEQGSSVARLDIQVLPPTESDG